MVVDTESTTTKAKEKKPFNRLEFYEQEKRKAEEARVKRRIKKELSAPEKAEREAEKKEEKRRIRENELGVNRKQLLELEKREAEYKRFKVKKTTKKRKSEMHTGHFGVSKHLKYSFGGLPKKRKQGKRLSRKSRINLF